MKTKSFLYFNLRRLRLLGTLRFVHFSILCVLLFAACDGMKTELDITSITFPPKLSVTAILDHGTGTFTIALMEGRALADYAKPFPNNMEIVRNGEIRLYEDDALLWNRYGPFDMSIIDGTFNPWDGTWDQKPQNGYHHIEHGIVTRVGSEYRLEVEVEGYETAVSASVMPAAPDVSISVNADEEAIRDFRNVHHISSLNVYGWGSDQYYDGGYCPFSVHFSETDANVRKYYVLEIHNHTDAYYDDVFKETTVERSAVGVSELSKLQDNPDVEAFELLMDTEPAGLYRFAMLFQSNLTFSNGSNALNFYADNNGRGNHCEDDQHYAGIPHFAKFSFKRALTLRVICITPETFRYYRSLTLQSMGMDFFSEPVTITGNIENGYGGFSVYNSVSIPLMEYEGCYYRHVGF
jgi:hypothetical protein